MADQLTFNLGLDASPMIKAATQATQELEQKFKQAGDNIRQDMGKPITIQAEFDLSGDPKKKYDEIVGSQKKILREQAQINKTTKQTQILNNLVARAVKGTTQEKKAALKQVERLLQNTRKTKTEMQLLEKAAKDLKNSLPTESDMGFAKSGGDFGGAALFNANIKAMLFMATLRKLGEAFTATIQTGMKMQTLTLQMEAFAGSANNAEIAMAQFADIASRSPLDVLQVAEAGKIMMAFGVETGLATEATQRLATVSAATGGDIELLARNLGQVQAQGRAYTRDLTQFAIQGIPIWEEMAKVTGKSVAELKVLAREGEIGMNTVMQALRNMTAEGSKFAEIADRMQETYAGKLAKMQSDFQMTAGAIIAQIARIDESIGASEQVMLMFNASLRYLQNSTGEFGQAMENSSYSALVMRNSVASVSDEVRQSEQANRNWVQSLLGIDWSPFDSAAGSISEVKRETDGARRVSEDWGISMTVLTEKLAEMLAAGDPGELVPKFRGLAAEAGLVTDELNEQIAKYMELNGITNERIEQEIEDYKLLRDEASAALADIEKHYADLKDEAVSTYNDIKTAAETSIDISEAIIDSLDEQISKTRELGPAGRQLKDIKRKELEYQAKTGKELTGHVTKEQRKKLEAQAALERLDGQAEAARLQALKLDEQRKIEEKKEDIREAEVKMQEEIQEIEKDKVEQLKQQNDKVGELNKAIGSLVDILNGNLAPNWDTIKTLIGDSEVETQELNTKTNVLNGSIKKTLTRYNNILTKLKEIASEIRNMPDLPSGPPNAFSGGPVSAGDKRTVNELGKEAFLSASGKLSMINAPAWGEWTAPSKGTIIPAHLTKQLDIPTGGINVNRNAGATASSVRPARVIQQAAAGDTFNQSVTIQAINPTQAANNMMVEMTRLKRRRFR